MSSDALFATRDSEVKQGEKEMTVNLVTVTDANFQAEVLDSKLPVLVDFWAPWCGPCRMVGPVVEELAQEYQGRLVVGKLNADQNYEVPAMFGIQGIPTLMLFKDGKLVGRQVGALPKVHLKAFIERNLGQRLEGLTIGPLVGKTG
jgi:thioredoxin 1